jgi:tetratricopeptide (TPR) repeat protein
MGKASRKKVSAYEAMGNQGKHENELKPPQESPASSSLQKTTSLIKFGPILILLLISFAVYFIALFDDFVYDDKSQIVDNPWIRDIRNIPTIFSGSVWSFRPGAAILKYYRPLMHIVYMFNYHLFGLKPWGFHLVNILFHCGVSVLVFLCIRRLLTEQRSPVSHAYLSPPFMAAMLFALHPIHTEAVIWIAGLPDVASTFFYLLSFYLYILFRNGVKRGYLLSILSFSAATLFKEPALTLPVILIAYDYLLKKPDETMLAGIKRYSPYLVVSGVYLLVRYYALRTVAPMEFYADLNTYQLIINVFPLFREYLASLLLPLELNFCHTFHPIISLFGANGMMSIAVAVLFLIVAMAAYKKNRLLFFSLLLIVVPLLPAFYIKAISWKPFAERYLYLPSVGFVFLPAIFLSWANEKLPLAAKSFTIVCIIIAGLYTFETINRNNVWKDQFNLWSDTVKKSPDSAEAHNNLGNEYASLGQLDRAVAEFRAALRLKPDYIEAHYNLGNEYASQGQLDKAVGEYRTALWLQPDYAEAHYNLGIAYASQNQWDRATAEFQAALRLMPDSSGVHNNLGIAYASQGQLDRATAEFQAALRLQPDYAEAHNNLGLAYALQGQLDMATAEFQAALKLRPDYYEARQRLNDIVSRRH